MNHAIQLPFHHNPYLRARSRGLHLVLPRLQAAQASAEEAASLADRPALPPQRRLGVFPENPAALPPDPTRRKGPHSLRLALAEPAPAEPAPAEPAPETIQQASQETVPAPYLAPLRQPAIAGVGCEFYRKYSEGLLRRYSKLSMEAGRVPSLLGRELFRGHVSSHKVSSFEDVAIFVHDIERCLTLLTPGQRHLVRRIALEEYTQSETAALLGLSLRTVIRRYATALDTLTRIFLDRKLLHPLTAATL